MNTKRLLALLLTLCMVFSLAVPGVAFAEDEETALLVEEGTPAETQDENPVIEEQPEETTQTPVVEEIIEENEQPAESVTDENEQPAENEQPDEPQTPEQPDEDEQPASASLEVDPRNNVLLRNVSNDGALVLPKATVSELTVQQATALLTGKSFDIIPFHAGLSNTTLNGTPIAVRLFTSDENELAPTKEFFMNWFADFAVSFNKAVPAYDITLDGSTYHTAPIIPIGYYSAFGENIVGLAINKDLDP